MDKTKEQKVLQNDRYSYALKMSVTHAFVVYFMS